MSPFQAVTGEKRNANSGHDLMRDVALHPSRAEELLVNLRFRPELQSGFVDAYPGHREWWVITTSEGIVRLHADVAVPRSCIASFVSHHHGLTRWETKQVPGWCDL